MRVTSINRELNTLSQLNRWRTNPLRGSLTKYLEFLRTADRPPIRLRLPLPNPETTKTIRQTPPITRVRTPIPTPRDRTPMYRRTPTNRLQIFSSPGPHHRPVSRPQPAWPIRSQALRRRAEEVPTMATGRPQAQARQRNRQQARLHHRPLNAKASRGDRSVREHLSASRRKPVFLLFSPPIDLIGDESLLSYHPITILDSITLRASLRSDPVSCM